MGRVVLTHSTYLEGLIPLLKRLAIDTDIKTITPGQIKRVRGRSQSFKLKITVPIKGGFKLIARRGNSAQEVFVVTTKSMESLKELIRRENQDVK